MPPRVSLAQAVRDLKASGRIVQAEPEAVKRLVAEGKIIQADQLPPRPDLTAYQQSILFHYQRGQRGRQLALLLGISTNAANQALKRLARKLNLESVRDLRNA